MRDLLGCFPEGRSGQQPRRLLRVVRGRLSERSEAGGEEAVGQYVVNSGGREQNEVQ